MEVYARAPKTQLSREQREEVSTAISRIYDSGREKLEPSRVAEARELIGSLTSDKADNDARLFACGEVVKAASRGAADGISQLAARNDAARNYFFEVGTRKEVPKAEKQAARKVITELAGAEAGKPAREINLETMQKIRNMVDTLGDPWVTGAFAATCESMSPKLRGMGKEAALAKLTAGLEAPERAVAHKKILD